MNSYSFKKKRDSLQSGIFGDDIDRIIDRPKSVEVKILKVPVGRRHHFVIQLSGDSMVDEFQIELRQFVEQFDLGKKRDPINLAPYGSI